MFWGATIQPATGGMYKKGFSLHDRRTMREGSKSMPNIPTSYYINFFLLNQLFGA